MITFEQVMAFTSHVSSNTAFEDEECLALYDLCCAMKPHSVVVEIGCQLGRTSSIIAQVGKSIGYQSIHIDPYTEQPEFLVQWHRMMHSIGNPYTHHCMRTDQVDMGEWVIDLLLIDGDHTEHGVRTDCVHAAKQVNTKSGIMCAHDYGRDSLPDVWKVMSEFAIESNWQPLGVAGTLGMWRRKR